MQTTSSDFIDVTNEVGTSGLFIKLLRSGRYPAVGKLLQQHRKLSKELAEIEGKLCACNNWVTLGEFANRYRDPQVAEAKLRAIASDLETQKSSRIALMQGIDGQLAQDEVVGDWETIPSPPISLVPRTVRISDESLVERNKMIDANIGFSDQRICKLLDQHFSSNGSEPAYHMPSGWMKDFEVNTFTEAYHHHECRKRVEPMISKRRKIAVYLQA